MAGIKTSRNAGGRVKTLKRKIIRKVTPSHKTKKKLKTAGKVAAVVGGVALAAGAAYTAYNYANDGGYENPNIPTSGNLKSPGNLRGSKHIVNYSLSNDLGRAFDTHLGGSATMPPNAIGSKPNTGLFDKTNLERMRQQNLYKQKHQNLSPDLQQKLANTRASYKATQPRKPLSSDTKLDAARLKYQNQVFSQKFAESAKKGHPFGKPAQVYGV